MKIELLEDLYKQELTQLHDAERQVRRNLNKMARVVSSTELQQMFRRHARETKGQLDRLESILNRLGGGEQARKSKAMSGMLADSKDLLKNPASDRDLMDTAFTLSAQKVEAFEIFTYGNLIQMAKVLNFHSDAEALNQTLEEEKRMEERLATLSQSLTLDAAETEIHQEVASG